MGFLTDLLHAAAQGVFLPDDILNDEPDTTDVASPSSLAGSRSSSSSAIEISPLAYRHRSTGSTNLSALVLSQLPSNSPSRHKETIEDWEIRHHNDLAGAEKDKLERQRQGIEWLESLFDVLEHRGPTYIDLMDKDPSDPVLARSEAIESHWVRREQILQELHEEVRQVMEDIRKQSSEPIDASKCEMGYDAEESFKKALQLMGDLERLCSRRRRKEQDRILQKRDGRNDSAIALES